MISNKFKWIMKKMKSEKEMLMIRKPYYYLKMPRLEECLAIMVSKDGDTAQIAIKLSRQLEGEAESGLIQDSQQTIMPYIGKECTPVIPKVIFKAGSIHAQSG